MRNALFLSSSLLLGWAFTLLLDLLPAWRVQVPAGLAIVALVALIATTLLARPALQNRAKGHPADDLRRQARGFRLWFMSHALFWLCIFATLIWACVQLFYWQVWVVALVAGLATAWSACLLGLLWPARAPLLGLCWQYQDTTLFRNLCLPIRYRATLATDMAQAKPKTPYLMAILEQGTVTGMARYARLQPQRLPWASELRSRSRDQTLLTAISGMFALMILLALGGLGYLLNAPLQLPGLQASQQAAQMREAAEDQVAQQAKQDASADDQQQGSQSDQQQSDSNGDASNQSQADNGSNNGDATGSESDQSNADEGANHGSESPNQQNDSNSNNSNDSSSPDRSNSNQNNNNSPESDGNNQSGSQDNQQGDNQGQSQSGEGQQPGDASGDQPGDSSGQQPGSGEGQGQGASGPGESQGQQGQAPGDGGDGSGSGSSGDGAGSGGDAPQLGQRQSIGMPPPGVGKVVTIEAPEIEDPNAAERESEIESLKASDEPPTALDARTVKQNESAQEAQEQEGRSLQYLPNWIRHIKKDTQNDSEKDN